METDLCRDWVGVFKARIIRMVAVHTLKSNLRRRAAADHLAK